MLKLMKCHQLKQYLNHVYIWQIVNKIECNYVSLIIPPRPLLYQYKWGGRGLSMNAASRT